MQGKKDSNIIVSQHGQKMELHETHVLEISTTRTPDSPTIDFDSQ